MCTLNISLSDAVMEQVRPVFPSQKAIMEFAQQQLESIFLKIVNQRKMEQELSARVKTMEQLSPEIQEILTATAPLKGVVPEWDLNGDMYRTEALKEKYGY